MKNLTTLQTILTFILLITLIIILAIFIGTNPELGKSLASFFIGLLSTLSIPIGKKILELINKKK